MMLILFEYVHFKDQVERNRMMLIIFEGVHFKDEIERNRMILIIFERVHFENEIERNRMMKSPFFWKFLLLNIFPLILLPRYEQHSRYLNF